MFGKKIHSNWRCYKKLYILQKHLVICSELRMSSEIFTHFTHNFTCKSRCGSFLKFVHFPNERIFTVNYFWNANKLGASLITHWKLSWHEAKSTYNELFSNKVLKDVASFSLPCWANWTSCFEINLFPALTFSH